MIHVRILSENSIDHVMCIVIATSKLPVKPTILGANSVNCTGFIQVYWVYKSIQVKII